MKIVTSATVFNDSVGMRMSMTYSEIDGATGKIISDNIRENRVLTSTSEKEQASKILEIAQRFVNGVD